jgi:hypothetical protein
MPPQPATGSTTEAAGAEPTSAPEEPGQPMRETKTLRVYGAIPSEVWNRLGTKVLPKLKSGSELKVGVDFTVKVDNASAAQLESDLRQILDDLGLASSVRTELQ